MSERHTFEDPIHPWASVALVFDKPAYGGAFVEHPYCGERAIVSPELDAFYCATCAWNGRISGAWFYDLWSEFVVGAAITDCENP